MSKELNNNSLEIIVQTKELAYVLSFAASVVEKRNVVSELSNVKLVARDGILEIGATDLDLYLNQTIGAEVKKEGQSTVSTQILSEIVRKIPDKEIILKQDAGSEYLHVIGNSCKFDLLTLPASNFPQMEDLEAEVSLKVNCEEFARIVEYTSFAMSNEETRYNLNGIYLHVKNGEFLSAATDAHRFSIASSKIEANIKDFGVIIPKKTVVELLKIVKDTKNIHSDISVALRANKVKFACNNLLLMSKLIDGNFPEYESFIPNSNKSKLTINTKLLASAIDRVATVTVDKFRAIKILLNDTCLAITATGEAKGAANESINFSDHKESYCSFSGNNLTIGFNPRYIMDVLGTLKEEQVHIYLNDASSPALIKTLENPRDSFVIMPVKV
jgi:DNA polymerase-3 subunit beta